MPFGFGESASANEVSPLTLKRLLNAILVSPLVAHGRCLMNSDFKSRVCPRSETYERRTVLGDW